MALQPKIIKKYPILAKIRNLSLWIFLFYLKLFAKLALLSFSGTSIGIAGAVGKSTTRNALNAILVEQKPTLVVSGNSETGIPLGLLRLSIGSYKISDIFKVILLAPFRIFKLKDYDFLIVEMGIDGPLPPKNMGYLLSIIKPDLGILLNESPAHSANYEAFFTGKPNSLEDIVRFMTVDDGKMLLNPKITTVVVNGDDPYIWQFAQNIPKNLLHTVGSDPKFDCYLLHHEIGLTGTTFEFFVHSFQEKDVATLFFPELALPKEASVAIGAAIIAALSLGIPINKATSSLVKNFRLPPGRGSILKGINSSTIIDSSYNASSASVLSFLELLQSLASATKNPSVFVMGDMKELGSYSQNEHLLVAKKIPEFVGHVVLVGSLTKDLVLPYLSRHKSQLKSLVHFDSSRQAGEYLKQHLPKKAVVLFKGSQLLEEAIKLILENPKDIYKLCRQDAFWQNAKQKNGTWVKF